MGTRYDDQPPEHWAGPESLDPTPVWKQFLVVGLLALGALAIIAIVSLFALAPQLATPPALVPGDRLVLTRAQAQGEQGSPVRVVTGPGEISFGEAKRPDEEAVWLFHLGREEFVAVSERWRDPGTGEACAIHAMLGARRALADPTIPAFGAAGPCAAGSVTFGVRGEPLDAPRGLDRYLVSVDGDRVIVNLSREIRGFGKTPQPTRSPL